MKIKYSFIVAFVVVLSVVTFQKNNQNGFKDTDLKWWAEAMASEGESGGATHTLDCGTGLGACQGECGIHQVKLTGTGAGTAVMTCPS